MKQGQVTTPNLTNALLHLRQWMFVELQIVILHVHVTSFARPPALFMAPNMLWKLNWLIRTVTLTKYERNLWCIKNIKSISSTNVSKCEENHSNDTTIPGLPPSIKFTGTHFIHLGRERHCESNVLPSYTTQCPWPGLKPRPLALEWSMLTIRPPGPPNRETIPFCAERSK